MKVASLAISVLLIAPTHSALSSDITSQTPINYQSFEELKDGFKKSRRFSFSKNTIENQSSKKFASQSVPKYNVYAENVEFTAAEVANNQFTILDNGNEAALPYFGTALHFNADNTGMAGFDGSSFFYEQGFNWSVNSGVLRVVSEPRTEVQIDYQPFENIARKYGQDLADHLNTKVEAGELDYEVLYTEEANFDVNISKLVTDRDHFDIRMYGTDFTYLNVPEAWGWPVSAITSSTSFDRESKLYAASSSVLSELSQFDLAGKWLIGLSSNFVSSFAPDGELGTYSDRLTLNSDGTVTDVFSANAFTWSAQSGVISLIQGDTKFEITPIINVGKGYLASVKQYEHNQLIRMFNTQIARFDDSYNEFTANLVTEFPYIWAAASNLYNEQEQGLAISFDNLFGYKFLKDGTFHRGVSSDYEQGNSLQFGQKWGYNFTGNNITLSYQNEWLRRERTWEILSVDDNGMALVFEYSYIGYDDNDDGNITDEEMNAFIHPRLNSLLKTDLSNYEAWNNLPDSDNDGLKDIEEEELGTDIYNPDSDLDGLDDGEEVTKGTNPLDQDSDGDGFTDGFEVAQGSDPLSSSSIPGSSELSFATSEVANQHVALLSEAKSGWIQHTGLAIDFNSNGEAILGEQWLNAYSSGKANWQIENGIIKLSGDGNSTLSGNYYYYPFTNIEQRFGYDVAQWLREQVDAGVLNHEQFLEQKYEVIERKLVKHSEINGELNVISITKANTSLITPKAWGYTGQVNGYETILNEVMQWNSRLTSTFGVTSGDIQGKWLAFLDYELTFGVARGLGTQAGVYADTLALQSGGGVNTVNSSKKFSWDFSNGVLTLTASNEEVVITPFKQVGKKHLAYYQVYNNGELSHVYIAPLAKFDNSYTQFTSNLVTSLPHIQFAGINAHIPSAWTNDKLNLSDIFGYQFRNDGTMRRGISGYEYDETLSFAMGQEWIYTLNGNRIIMSYSDDYTERERTWDIVSVDDSGRALIFERSRYARDVNNDGTISADERGPFIAPRINSLDTIDLSDWEDAWNALPDQDSDGLNDFQEDDLGTNKASSDSDNDGLTDSEEVAMGLNPLSFDSDGDGFTDSFEIAQGTDPLNAGSTPGSTTLSFVADDVDGKRIAMTDPAQVGWLAHTGVAIKFNANTTGNIGSGWTDNYSSSSFIWEVINGQIHITDLQNSHTAFNYSDYPFDSLREKYGNEVTDWLMRKVENNEIPSGIQFEELYEQLNKVLTMYGEDNGQQEVILSTKNQVSLMLPSEWNYQGETPTYQYMDESIRDLEINPTNLFTGKNSAELQGKWSLSLPLKVTYGPARNHSSVNGIYADILTLNNNGFAESGHFGGQYQWAVDEDKLVISNSAERIEVMPFKQQGNKLLGYYEVYQAGGLSKVYIAPLAKFDNTYAKLTNNLVTQLPQMQLAHINAHMPTYWNDNHLSIDGVWGYHFRDDGTLRRGLGGSVDYETGATSLYMGEEWNYSVNSDRITLTYADDWRERERIWDIISVDSNGRALLFERSTNAYDMNNDGVIADDERGIFIAPRINSIELFDLSNYEEWDALPDSDADGLNDFQEADLGTDIYNEDTDFDGISDFDEVNNGLNPLDATDAAGDADNDGLSNIDELLFGTDINNADTDGDGVSDGDEIKYGTNPLDPTDITNPPSNMMRFSDINDDGVFDWLTHSLVDNTGHFSVVDGRDFTEYYAFNIDYTLSSISMSLLGDRNNDGVKEIGLFGFNADVERYQLYVYNGYTGQSMGTWNWPNTLGNVTFELLADLTKDGIEEYAITGVHLTNGTKQLIVKNGVTRQTHQTFKWPNLWLDTHIVTMSDVTNDGVPEVALYGRHERLDKGQLFVFDGANANNKLDVYNWNKLWTQLSLHKMDDLDSDGTTDWGQFGQRKDDGRYQWVVKKGHDKRGVIRTFSWPNDLTEAKPLLLADRTGDGVREVSLYGKSSNGKVFLRVNDGRLANTRVANFAWPAAWRDEQVIELGDLNNDGYTEVALLGVNRNSGKYQLVIKDGQATTEYGRLTLDGNWRDLVVSSYDANSDGKADIILNGVDADTLTRSMHVYSGESLTLISTTTH